MGNEKVTKFLRALHAQTQTLNSSTSLAMRIIYEFWGFCVNGGNDLRAPGGFATTAATGSISMPTNWESGSTVLLASGSDGSTVDGNLITAPSVTWTSSWVGKYVTLWKSGSSCTDDSIYQIVRVPNTSSVYVDVTSGGTPMSGSGRLSFTTRTDINFRVIDLYAAANLSGLAANQYMVLQFNGAPAVNPGQAVPQARLRLQQPGSYISDCHITLSPSGSWNGSAFSDPTPDIPIADWPYVWGERNTTDYGGTYDHGYFTMICDQASLLYHLSAIDAWCSNSRPSIHIEVPNRLYPADVDPNPICAMNGASISTTLSYYYPEWYNGGYAGGMYTANPLDNVLGASTYSVPRMRSLAGSSFDTGSTAGGYMYINSYGTGVRLNDDRFKQAFYNPRTGKVIIFDLVYGVRKAGYYTASRIQLRRTALCLASFPTMMKLGNNGEWIHMGGGVLWPWDNAVMPHTLIPT